MSESSDEEKIDGNTTPHGLAARGKTHQGGNSKGTCTQRSVSPPATCQPATGHSPNGQEDITDRPPVTSQMGIIQEFSLESVNHQSLAIQPPVITGEINIYRSLVNRPPVTGHQTLYQHIISETHAMGMEFTNNSASSKKVYYPWNRTLVICPIPVLSWNCPKTTRDRTTDKFLRLPSMEGFQGGVSLEININPRRGGDVDRLLHPPLRCLHLQTLAEEAESKKDPNILTRRGEEDIFLFFFCIW